MRRHLLVIGCAVVSALPGPAKAQCFFHTDALAASSSHNILCDDGTILCVAMLSTTSTAVAGDGASAANDFPPKRLPQAPCTVCMELCAEATTSDGSSSLPTVLQDADATSQDSPARVRDSKDTEIHPSHKALQDSRGADFNRDIYYANKLEFALDGGWFPINIPFPLDFTVSASYSTYPLKYTLVPIIASLRWHLDDVGGPWILRGNWDVTFSGSYTAIPRGPETHYFSYDMGARRNFVPRNWRFTPYWDVRLGLGRIDAKGPVGVYYAQGQNFTFTINMGSGVRYNFNSHYAISAGLNVMHISNANLSSGSGYANFGINVYGPIFGIDMQLRRHPRH
jgi:lipid A 3-O-deacylase PagL